MAIFRGHKGVEASSMHLMVSLGESPNLVPLLGVC